MAAVLWSCLVATGVWIVAILSSTPLSAGDGAPYLVGPFRVVFGRLDPANPSPADRAANGLLESAKADGPDKLLLEAWRGDDGAGKRSMGWVRLHTPPERQDMWVGVDLVDLQLAAKKDGKWISQPHKQQDAHLRLEWHATPATALPTASGSTIVDSEGSRWAALVLDLAVRIAPYGESAWTAPAGGAFTALVQVPAGMSLMEARKDPANVLAELPFLNEYKPNDGDLAFRLGVDNAGGWKLDVDRGRDGSPETILTPRSPGCKPCTLTGIGGRSGLIINWLPEGGAKPGTVALSTLRLWYSGGSGSGGSGGGSSATGTSAPTASARAGLEIPTTAMTSPVRIRGPRIYGTPSWTVAPMRSDDGPGIEAMHELGRNTAEVVVHLNAEQAQPVMIVTATDQTVTGAITWTPIRLPLAGAMPLRVLAGDSLLIDTDDKKVRWKGPGAHVLPKRKLVPICFATIGRHLIQSGDIDGTPVDELVVDAMPSGLPALIAVPASGRTMMVPLFIKDDERNKLSMIQILDQPVGANVEEIGGGFIQIYFNGKMPARTLTIADAYMGWDEQGNRVKAPANGPAYDQCYGDARVVPLTLTTEALGPPISAGTTTTRMFRLRMDPWQPQAAIRITSRTLTLPNRSSDWVLRSDSATAAVIAGKRLPVMRRLRTATGAFGVVEFQAASPSATSDWLMETSASFDPMLAPPLVVNQETTP